jgi:hypothetical protein
MVFCFPFSGCASKVSLAERGSARTRALFIFVVLQAEEFGFLLSILQNFIKSLIDSLDSENEFYFRNVPPATDGRRSTMMDLMVPN